MKIFLDDIRETPIGWVRTYTAEETIKLLSNFNVTDLSLDHDLGDERLPGYFVLNWIETQVLYHHYRPPKIYLHTANPAGRDRMQLAINSITRLVENRHVKS